MAIVELVRRDHDFVDRVENIWIRVKHHEVALSLVFVKFSKKKLLFGQIFGLERFLFKENSFRYFG